VRITSNLKKSLNWDLSSTNETKSIGLEKLIETYTTWRIEKNLIHRKVLNCMALYWVHLYLIESASTKSTKYHENLVFIAELPAWYTSFSKRWCCYSLYMCYICIHINFPPILGVVCGIWNKVCVCVCEKNHIVVFVEVLEIELL
jgi:hypothetical protein